MKLSICLSFLLFAILVAPTTQASDRNDLPSCREHFFKKRPALLRDFVIAIDRTTRLNPTLVKDTLARIQRALRPGDRVMLVSFSGTNQDHFLFVEFDGRIDPSPSDEELETEIPGNLATKVADCFPRAFEWAQREISKRLETLLTQPLVNAPGKSEILASLSALTHNVSAEQPAKKVFLVISDLMENSDFANFYSGIRASSLIEPQTLVEAAKRQGLVADLHGTEVYVVGAGFVPAGKTPMSVAQRRSLKRFWEAMIHAGGGSLVGWGEPALLADF